MVAGGPPAHCHSCARRSCNPHGEPTVHQEAFVFGTAMLLPVACCRAGCCRVHVGLRRVTAPGTAKERGLITPILVQGFHHAHDSLLQTSLQQAPAVAEVPPSTPPLSLITQLCPALLAATPAQANKHALIRTAIHRSSRQRSPASPWLVPPRPRAMHSARMLPVYASAAAKPRAGA